jgi:ABC-type antimicrobial peptide transport system permease subunit
VSVLAEDRRGTASTIEMIRSTVDRELPEMTVQFASHIEDVLALGLGPRRLVSASATSFAIVALLLAAVGLHGMVSHGVMIRGKEIGIRMALGATARTIASESVRPLAILVICGIAVGSLFLLLAKSVLLSVMVPPPGVAYPSLITASVTALVALVTAVAMACYPPIRTASGIDPASALRAD